MRSKFDPFIKRYGDLASQELKDTYQKQKIRLTRATLAQRRAAIKKAKNSVQ